MHRCVEMEANSVPAKKLFGEDFDIDDIAKLVEQGTP